MRNMAARSWASRSSLITGPASSPVVPERMGEVDVGAEVLEQIGGPVPAIGGLEDHLGIWSGFCHGLGELEGLARDAHAGRGRLPPLTSGRSWRCGGEVDSDVLAFHRGLLLLSRVLFAKPECLSRRSDLHEGGGPPFIASGQGAMRVGNFAAAPAASPIPIVRSGVRQDLSITAARLACALIGHRRSLFARRGVA